MLKIIISSILSILIFAGYTGAQTNFAEKCLGVWEGTMKIYAAGALKDTVKVRLTVAKTAKPDEYTWKTEYLSPTRPVVKDYRLRVEDAAKGVYVTDEGDGVELVNYLFEDKLYNVFEVEGIVLTAVYERRGAELIFEVTSGKKLNEIKGVTNFSVANLQRVVFKKIK